MKILALIPHYNHAGTVGRVAAAMREQGLDVLIVDDGSHADCRSVLDALARQPGVAVHYRPQNGGKGAAVKSGLDYAQEHGYTHVLQVDADAQHHLPDAAKLIEQSNAKPQSVVCGWPQYGEDAPKSRLYGRKITDFWNMVNTGGFAIKDSMCGFRLYPVATVQDVVKQECLGDRMDFDTEILVHLCWRGAEMVWVKTPVQYAAGGVSHFNAWHDNVRISKMHARLFFGMLARRLSGRWRR